MQQKAFLTFFTLFNQAISTRRPTILVPYSQDTLNFVRCLKANSLIYGYSILGNDRKSSVDNINQRLEIKVFLIFTSNNPLVQHLFIYSSKKRVLEISLIELKKFQNRIKSTVSPLLLLQTSRGILTHLEAIKLGYGGRLVGRIIL